MIYELNKLYNEDCMEAMKNIPDQFFDLAIVDPPYGIGIDGQNKDYYEKASKRLKGEMAQLRIIDYL